MRNLSRNFLALVVLAATAGAQSPCGPNGLVLNWNGTTRLGDQFTVSLSGTPSVTGLIAGDVAQGPVQTPVGPVCLGLTSALQIAPFTLDGLGAWSVATVIPQIPTFAGLDVFLQAAAFDATQPGGVALSNGVKRSLRTPRLWILPTFASTQTVCVYDVLTDTPSPPIPIPPWYFAAAMPELGWLALVVTTPAGYRLRAIDATGATMADVSIPWFAYNMQVDGTFVILNYGTSIQRISLPSGAAGPQITVASSAYGFALNPGTSTAFIGNPAGVLPVDLATGAISPVIPHGAPSVTTNGVGGILVKYGILYCILSGTGIFGTSSPAQIAGIDLATLMPIAPSMFLPGPLAISMRAGGDQAGPAIFVCCQGSLLRVDPSTLQYQSIGSVGYDGMPSAGANEFLSYANNLVHAIDLNTYAASSVPIPSGGAPILSVGGGTSNFVIDGSWMNSVGVFTVPSTTLRKAYVMTGVDAANPQTRLIRYATDPLTTAQGVVTLPVSSSSFFTIVD